jgi:aminoglycoside phosphotransferase (APT) family kinase protein
VTGTGPAAGVHLPWSQVPEAVQAWTARLAGEKRAAPAVRDLSGGFSPGATSILEWPNGRSLFVKAVGSSLNTESPNMHRREVVVSRSLPHGPQFPRLVDDYDDGDWVALAFEVVEGRPPRHPWDAEELALVVDALSALHEELTPAPDAGISSLAEYARHLFGGWRTLADSDTRDVPGALDSWAAAHLDALAELEAAWPEACAGSTLVHGDVRSDNVLIGQGREVVLVDWPHASVGQLAFDVVAWAPSVVLEGGPPPEELLARHPAAREVDADVVTVLLAAVSGFFISHSLLPAPPGLPTLRRFQVAQGEVALAWLRRRTGWGTSR